MIRSMTGFGEGRASSGGCAVRVEVSSVNGRGFALKLRLPEALSACQSMVESKVREHFERGTLTITAELKHARGKRRVRLNLRLLAEYARELEHARRKLRSLPPPDWQTLSTLPGVLEPLRDEGALPDTLMKALEKALAACARTRAREGRATSAACSGLLGEAEKALSRAEERREGALAAYRERLAERTQAVLSREGLVLSEPDLRREILLHAERSDVAEEASRLKAHLKEARRCLEGSGPAGRRLDFLAQEMMREGNTLASKSLDAALSLAAIDLKTALDRFKEQVQNIE